MSQIHPSAEAAVATNGAQPDQGSAVRDGSSPRRTVLVAERDRSVRELLQFFLERAGYAVVLADDGVAALERALEAPPAVVVTEILLPRLDGLTLCRRLRDDPRTSDVPVIVFSVLAAGTRAAEAGAHAFLRKPLVEAVFLGRIRDAIAAKPTASMEQSWASR